MSREHTRHKFFSEHVPVSVWLGLCILNSVCGQQTFAMCHTKVIYAILSFEWGLLPITSCCIIITMPSDKSASQLRREKDLDKTLANVARRSGYWEYKFETQPTSERKKILNWIWKKTTESIILKKKNKKEKEKRKKPKNQTLWGKILLNQEPKDSYQRLTALST